MFYLERPFFTVGVSYLVSLILAGYLPNTVTFYLIFVFAVLFFIFLIIKRTRQDVVLPVVVLATTFAFGVYIFNYTNTVKPIEETLKDKDATITASVCDLPYKSFNKYYYTLKTESIDVPNTKKIVPQNLKLRMSLSKGLDLDVYDKITCKVHFYTKDDEGPFSSKSYYRAKGINVFACMHEYEDYKESPGTSRPIYYYFLKLKQNLISALKRVLLNDNADLAQGLLLGDKYNISEDIKDDFKDIGISHLLSVSGLHTSVITSLLISLFLFLKFSKKAAYLLTCVGILLFAGITGFATSVVRASIMCIIYLIGMAFGKKADSLNSLGFAILCICVFNPFSGGDIGFLLSVCSTLGIILLEPKLEKIVKEKLEKLKYAGKFINYLLPLVCVTICATLFTLPISLLYFKEISLVSVLSNILIVAPSTLMFTFTLLSAVFYLIVPLRFLGMLLGIFSNWFLSYTIKMASILSKIPLASVSTNRSYLMFWVASVILLLAITLILAKNNYKKYIKLNVLISLILLFTGILSHKVFSNGLISFAVLDVGDGLSLVLTKNNHCAVISCGGDNTKESKLLSYLKSNNIKNIDYLILDGFNDSNSLYAKDILEKLRPSILVIPDSEDIDEKISKRINEEHKGMYYYKNGATIKLWNDAQIEPHYGKDLSYTKIKVNGINMLACNSCRDLSKIPSENSDCDILIESENFKNLNSFDTKYVVMSNSQDTFRKNYKDIAKNGKIPITTANCGSLVFEFIRDKDVILKRVKI